MNIVLSSILFAVAAGQPIHPTQAKLPVGNGVRQHVVGGHVVGRHYGYGWGWGGHGWNGYGWGGYNAAATSGIQAALVGRAALLRADGARAKDLAEARKTHAEADIVESQAHVARVTSFFEGRRINQEYRELEQARRPSLTHEQRVALAKQMEPKRLDQGQLDRASADIRWPVALLRPEFQAQRRTIEHAVDNAAGQTTLVAPGDVLIVLANIEAMEQELRLHIHGMNSQSYVEAKRFLRSLGHEIKQIAS